MGEVHGSYCNTAVFRVRTVYFTNLLSHPRMPHWSKKKEKRDTAKERRRNKGKNRPVEYFISNYNWLVDSDDEAARSAGGSVVSYYNNKFSLFLRGAFEQDCSSVFFVVCPILFLN